MVKFKAEAEKAGFVQSTFNAGKFVLFGLQRRNPDPGSVLTVYIEGDGWAWRRRNQPSADPTPRNAITLALALKDPSPAVLYLGRPCQFHAPPMPPTCDHSLWTTHRYGETVITAVNAAISDAAAGFEQVALVGYSGGGTIAALVAARRQDVAWIITVAANLDHRAWTELHQVSPLFGSINAADVAESIQNIPQLHLVGKNDKTVTPEIIQSYVNRMSDTSMTRVRIEADFDHECCWGRRWPELMNYRP